MGAVTVDNRGFLGALVALFAGCGTAPPDSNEIRLGMTKAEVVALLGEPAEVREPVANQRGEMQDVWQYVLKPDAETGGEVATGVLTSGIGSFDDPTEGYRYLFHFDAGGRLVRWGPENPR